MIDLLTKLGTPLALAAALALAAYLVRQGSALIFTSRVKLREEAITSEISYIDAQLSEFYLPLRERLAILKRIFEHTQPWTGPAGYDNAVLCIESDDSQALRNIIVRRIFLPLNQEVERLILDGARYRFHEDSTDYGVLLQHFVLWRALEEAQQAGEIRSYDAHSTLHFPIEQSEAFRDAVAQLLDTRQRLRTDLLRLRSPADHLKVRSDYDA